MPSGCRLTRSTLAGGSSSVGVDAVDQQADGGVGGDQVPSGGRRPPPGRARARRRTWSSASRTGPISGSSSPRCAVHRRVARREQQRVALAQRDVEVLGEVQHHVPRSAASGPVSTKLRWRAEMPASSARSSWLSRRRWRQSRRRVPPGRAARRPWSCRRRYRRGPTAPHLPRRSWRRAGAPRAARRAGRAAVGQRLQQAAQRERGPDEARRPHPRRAPLDRPSRSRRPRYRAARAAA